MTVSSVQDLETLKSYFQALTPSELGELKNASSYYELTRLLRSNGWLNVFLGGLTLWLGLSGIDQGIFRIIQAMLGALILGQSLWALAQPVKPALLRFSFVFLLCGIWNIFLGIYDRFQGFAFLIIILGVAQLRWAYQFRQTYRRNLLISLTEPTSEVRARFEEIRKLMTSRRIKDDDLFLMQLKGRWWNCLPLSNLLMLSPHQGGFFILAEKSEVVLRPAHPNLTARRQFSVLVKLKEELLTGKIQRAGYEKYVFWKGETDPSNLPELAQKWRNRRIIWYAEVGILVLIGLYILSIFLYLRPYM